MSCDEDRQLDRRLLTGNCLHQSTVHSRIARSIQLVSEPRTTKRSPVSGSWTSIQMRLPHFRSRDCWPGTAVALARPFTLRYLLAMVTDGLPDLLGPPQLPLSYGPVHALCESVDTHSQKLIQISLWRTLSIFSSFSRVPQLLNQLLYSTNTAEIALRRPVQPSPAPSQLPSPTCSSTVLDLTQLPIRQFLSDHFLAGHMDAHMGGS